MAQEVSSPFTAGCLSAFIPGVGQMYAGQVGRGVGIMIVNICFSAITAATGGAFLFFQIPYCLWALSDAAQCARAANAKHRSKPVPHQHQYTHYSAPALPAATPSHSQAQSRQNTSIINASEFAGNLERASRLHRAGILDDTEYQHRKRQIIETLSGRKLQTSPDEFLFPLLDLVEQGHLTSDEVARIKMLIL